MPEKSPPTGAANLKVLLCPLAVLFFVVTLSAQVPRTILSQPSTDDRPYPNAYFNQRLPNAGAGGPTNHLMPGSDAIINNIMQGGNATGAGAWATNGLDDVQHRALYYGQATDPVFQVAGCTGAASFVNGMKFHAPSSAPFSKGDSDMGITIWDQPTNTILSFYSFNNSGSSAGWTSLPACSVGSTCTFSRPNGYCSAQARTGSGVGAGTAASTAGLAPFGNNTRFAEVESGHIPHGLRGINLCSSTANGAYPSKVVFPATQNGGTPANSCSAAGAADFNRPPNGSLVFFDYTDAQLDCFNAAKASCAGINKLNSVQFALVEAATYYGITLEDTGPGDGIRVPSTESEEPYVFYEAHGSPGARAVADTFTSFMNSKCTSPWCSVTTRSGNNSAYQWNISWAGIPAVGGKNFAGHMHIADPCVAMGLQGLPGGCASGGVRASAPDAPTGLTATVQ